jgi:hypothetical protein
MGKGCSGRATAALRGLVLAVVLATLVAGGMAGGDVARLAVNGEPPVFSYDVFTVEDVERAADLGFNVVMGNHSVARQQLNARTAIGAAIARAGMKVMYPTMHFIGGPMLAEAIGPRETTIAVTESGLRAPTVIQLDDELIHVGRTDEGRLLDCERGYRGTEPAAHRRAMFVFEPDRAAAEIRAVCRSPQLWGYYMVDDPPGDCYSALKAAYAAVRREDRDERGRPYGHPVCMGGGGFDTWPNFGPDIADVLVWYFYPMRTWGYDRVWMHRGIQQALVESRWRVPGISFIGVCQTFSMEKEWLGPGADEIRLQAEDYVRQGAVGLGAYTCQTRPGLITGWNGRPDLWPALRALYTEYRRGQLRLGPPPDLPPDAVFMSPQAARPPDLPGVVRRWRVIGPFDNAGRRGFDEIIYPPERVVDFNAALPGLEGPVRWKTVDTVGPFGRLDLQRAVGFGDFRLAYVTCTVTSPRPRSLQLRLGHDDDAAAWLGGALVARKRVGQVLYPDQAIVPVEIPAGQTRLLVKVANQKGGWGVCARFTEPDGRPAAGLRFAL